MTIQMTQKVLALTGILLILFMIISSLYQCTLHAHISAQIYDISPKQRQ